MLPPPTNKPAAEMHAALVLKYLHKGYTDKALDQLQLAMHYAPNDPVVLDTAGYFYEKMGDTQLANGYYAEAMNTSPTSAAAKNNYGAFLCRNGYYQESVDFFMRAAKTSNLSIRRQAFNNARFCSQKMKSRLGDSAAYAYYSRH